MNKQNILLHAIATNKAVHFVGQVAQLYPNPMVSGAATVGSAFLSYVAQSYQDDQLQASNEYLAELNKRLTNLDGMKIDEAFLYSRDGRRLISKIMRMVYRDSRKEKIIAASHLTKKLIISSRLSIDEKELYVETLDSLNVLQLSILQFVTVQMWQRYSNPHRGFDWKKLASEYEIRGVKESLTSQSIRALDSAGLVNANTATVTGIDQTHFVTNYGEELVQFCTDIDKGSVSEIDLEKL